MQANEAFGRQSVEDLRVASWLRVVTKGLLSDWKNGLCSEINKVSDLKESDVGSQLLEKHRQAAACALECPQYPIFHITMRLVWVS